MSGVRAQNPELNALGLTLPGFVERNRIIASLPSLSLLTLAGLTPSDVDVRYLEIPDLSELRDLPGEFDAVAIASYTAQIKDAYELSARYRREGTTVILGGLHVTALPDEAARHADCIVLGEAEPVWPRIVHDLNRGSLNPVYDARTQSYDLHEAPLPRFELLDSDRYNRLTVQTQRGCPFLCEFCASSIRLTPRFKTKPVERVINEIRHIRSIWPQPFIEFADDNTFANTAHGKRLLRELSKEKIRWFTETDISIADDDEMLSLLRDSGCAQLLIGLEAPRAFTLDRLELRSNWKAKRADTYFEAIDRIQRHGITVNGCFILGLDGQDTSSFNDVLNFARQSALYDVQVTVLTPFPGTQLYARLTKEDRLLARDEWEKCTLFDVVFEPNGMTARELEEGFRSLVSQLYSDECTRWRRGEYRRRLRSAN